MLSISSAFAMYKCRNWHDLLDETRKAGFKSLELNVEVPEAWFPSIENAAAGGEIIISSLHNYCPKIEELPPGRTIYSGYLLTADNEDERKIAVQYTLRTIEWAKRVGAKAVVLHAGDVHTSPGGGEVYEYAKKFGLRGKLYNDYVNALMTDRKSKSRKCLERLKKSLEPVVKAASSAGLALGLENRMYAGEMPDIGEILDIIETFSGSGIGYWHDSGHAEIFVRMGFVKNHQEFMDALGDRLVGFHLHDMHGLSDHNAPGSGDFDFGILKPYAKDNVLKVIEAHPKATPEELRNSIKYLKAKGIE